MRWDFTQSHLRSQGHRLLGGRTATESEKRNGGFKEKRLTLLRQGWGTVEGPVFRFGSYLRLRY